MFEISRILVLILLNKMFYLVLKRVKTTEREFICSYGKVDILTLYFVSNQDHVYN